MKTVGDLMSETILSVAPSATVAETATMMGERHVGSALVMEEDRLLGIFTERDIVRALGQDFGAAERPVTEWMTPDPVTVDRGTAANDALKTMLDGGFRHLPVVEEGTVVGIVSMRDLSSAGVAD